MSLGWLRYRRGSSHPDPSGSPDRYRQLNLVDLVRRDVEDLNPDGRIRLPREVDEAVFDIAWRDDPISEVLRG